MADAPNLGVRYGRINTQLVQSRLRLSADQDDPFWALNLMKYRDVADYGGAVARSKSGREADDEYTPVDSLAAVGARIVFVADVERTLAGDGVGWDRVGIVLYPSRRKFFEMQQREDFKRSHVHKDAGMEFTIVMSALPVLPFEGAGERRELVEMSVAAHEPPGGGYDAAFSVEGVIVGDERIWRHVSFRWLAPDERPSRSTPVATGTDDRYTLVLRPTIDRLTRSVLEPETLPPPPRPGLRRN